MHGKHQKKVEFKKEDHHESAKRKKAYRRAKNKQDWKEVE